MSEVRADKLQGVWADDATVVASTPASPTTGVAYRNTASDSTVGFQFNTKSPSEVANQWLWTASKILEQLQTLGTLGWNSTTTYPVGAIAMASDGAIYQGILTGNTGKEPTTETTFWTKLDVLNRAMTSLSNITTVATAADSTAKVYPDVVTSYWVASDGNSFYRKYKSGYIEQGGLTGAIAVDSGVTVTFPIEFTSKVLQISVSRFSQNTNDTAPDQSVHWRVTGTPLVSFIFGNSDSTSNTNTKGSWFACGF